MSTTSQFKQIKAHATAGEHVEAFELLRSVADPDADFPTQHKYSKLLGRIDSQAVGLAPLRLALVPFYCSVDHFSGILKLWAGLQGFDLEIYVAEFDTAEQTLLNPSSELYEFKPDVIWLFTSWRDILQRGQYPDKDSDDLASIGVARLQEIWKAINTNSSAYILQNNADLPPDRVFGNHSPQIAWSRSNTLRAFNQQLIECRTSGLEIFDLDALSSLFGKKRWADERYWYHSKNSFSLDACGTVAFHAARLLCGLKGKSAKCLVLDLDNTMWGGVIGDDGMEGIRLGYGADGEAHQDLQRYILALKKRGLILAVCSKNEEDIARQPFEEHPDMILRPDDIAMFVANWHNKADNIRQIAKTLNIGLDALVFLDDNPVERALVREELPMVTVPELPDDPTQYLQTLDQGRYFEMVAYTDEDAVRNDMYRENACRAQLKESATDTETFLKGLKMESAAKDLNKFSLPRISQLINKGNQFHLTTTRYSEAELQQMMDQGYICRSYTLTDKFGDNGLISGIILKPEDDTLIVDTWVMSCRVLCRGMEQFIFNDMLALAQEAGATTIVGRHLPTAKNKMVADLYPTLGFTTMSETDEERVFSIEVANAQELEHFITPAQ